MSQEINSIKYKIKLFLKNNSFNMFYLISGAGFSILSFYIVGLIGYVARSHSLGINLLVWTTILLVVHIIVFLIMFIISISIKMIISKQINVHFFQGFTILGSLLGVTIFSMFQVNVVENSLFLSTLISVTTLYSIFFAHSIWNKNDHK